MRGGPLPEPGNSILHEPDTGLDSALVHEADTGLDSALVSKTILAADAGTIELFGAGKTA